MNVRQIYGNTPNLWQYGLNNWDSNYGNIPNRKYLEGSSYHKYDNDMSLGKFKDYGFAFFCCRTIQNTPIVKNKKSMICKPIIINSISFCHLLIHISIVISAPILSYYIKSFLTV